MTLSLSIFVLIGSEHFRKLYSIKDLDVDKESGKFYEKTKNGSRGKEVNSRKEKCGNAECKAEDCSKTCSCFKYMQFVLLFHVPFSEVVNKCGPAYSKLLAFTRYMEDFGATVSGSYRFNSVGGLNKRQAGGLGSHLRNKNKK